MPRILLSNRVRSCLPQQAKPESLRERRRKAPVPVLREEVCGVRFRDFPGLPPEIHNVISGTVPALLRRLYAPLQEAYQSGMETRLESMLSGVIPDVAHWLAREVMSAVLSHQRGFHGTVIRCHECDGELEYQRDQQHVVKTMVGEVTFSRAYYHGKCGHSAIPLDKLLGIDDERILHSLQDDIALLATDVPYDRARGAVCRWAHLALSKRTVEDVTRRIGDVERARQNEERRSVVEDKAAVPLGAPPAARVGVVAMDGGYCRIVKQQDAREFKVGVLGAFDPLPNRQEPQANDPHCLAPAPEVKQKRYLGRFDDADTFFERLILEFHKAGLHRLDTLVTVSDGADWIICVFR